MADAPNLSKAAIEELSNIVESGLRAAATGTDPLIVVKAPPGSGKTYMLLRAVEDAAAMKMRVAVGVQTNSQAADICERLAHEYPGLPVIRFAAAGATRLDPGPSVSWITDKKKLPQGACVVIATVAKWSLVQLEDPYDIMLVDEAWQMSWADFMLCAQVCRSIRPHR